MKFNLFSVLAILILVLVVMISQAKHLAWFVNLNGDITNFYSKAEYFSEHQTLRNLQNNEYQPGAIMYFIFLSIFSNNQEDFGEVFLWMAVLLIFSLAYLYFSTTNLENILIFAAILLSTGPIIFFRFEVLVGLLVVLSFYLFTKKAYFLALIFLGLATLTKIYPIVLLPLFLLLLLKTENFKSVLLGLVGYLTGLLVPLFVYMSIFKVSINELISSINFHVNKPVSLETIWASIITLVTKIIGGQNIELVGGWGVWGIVPEIIGNNFFYNTFWILLIGVMYIIISWKLKKVSLEVFIKLSLLVILILLFFSKVLAPQYLLWFTLLIPMLNFQNLANKTIWTVNLILILAIAYLTQYIYPLRYEELLNFYRGSGDSSIFWVNFLKNILLGILLINILVDLLKRPNTSSQ